MAKSDDLEDLQTLVRDAKNLLGEIRKESIKKPIEDLEKACTEIHRAWSGSNLGYHANVYYEGLSPRPAYVEFSSEWGLSGRWPVAEPDPGWTKMDSNAVRTILLGMAGNPNIPKLEKNIATIREKFAELKATLASILSPLATGKNADRFLEDRLKRAEDLKAPLTSEVEHGLLPRGSIFTRDTLALGQGLQIAPHQVIGAKIIAVSALDMAIDELKKIAQESAGHVSRMVPSKAANTKRVNNHTVFCGHGASLLWRELKDFIEKRLNLQVDEFNRVPTAGVPTATRLEEMLEDASFAFLVLTAEDHQPDGTIRARENVIHEAGLFQGKLGFGKAIILLEDGCGEFSNIHGLGQIRFPKGNIAAIFENIRAVLEREGLL